METSQSITKLAAALVTAQAQLKPVARTSENPFFHSKYADLGAVWDGCRAVLTANGLAVVQTPAAGSPPPAASIGVTTMLLHSSGEWIRDTAIYPLAKADPQGAGSAITYARRYGLSAMIGLVTEDDDDGNAASTPTELKKQRKTTNNEEAF
jgi:hypothetical protein